MVDDINVTKFVIENQELLAGYSYEAKVRARGPVGLWSTWSPKVVWMTEEGTAGINYRLLKNCTLLIFIYCP